MVMVISWSIVRKGFYGEVLEMMRFDVRDKMVLGYKSVCGDDRKR